jgi:hypothetical protein
MLGRIVSAFVHGRDRGNKLANLFFGDYRFAAQRFGKQSCIVRRSGRGPFAVLRRGDRVNENEFAQLPLGDRGPFSRRRVRDWLAEQGLRKQPAIARARSICGIANAIFRNGVPCRSCFQETTRP